MVYKFFDKNSSSLKDKSSRGSGINKENKGNFLQNSQLANELHKPIIKKFKKRKVYSSFKDNIWDVDLAGIRCLLFAIGLFSKYAFVVLLKDKKGATIINAFQSILNKSKRKPNKI